MVREKSSALPLFFHLCRNRVGLTLTHSKKEMLAFYLLILLVGVLPLMRQNQGQNICLIFYGLFIYLPKIFKFEFNLILIVFRRLRLPSGAAPVTCEHVTL